jgi:hypothetical protein
MIVNGLPTANMNTFNLEVCVTCLAGQSELSPSSNYRRGWCGEVDSPNWTEVDFPESSSANFYIHNTNVLFTPMTLTFLNYTISSLPESDSDLHHRYYFLNNLSKEVSHCQIKQPSTAPSAPSDKHITHSTRKS